MKQETKGQALLNRLRHNVTGAIERGEAQAIVEAPAVKPLQFITVREPKTGRASSLSLHGRRDDGMLRVVGGLEHNASIVPDSIEDANKLIEWLQEWKALSLANA